MYTYLYVESKKSINQFESIYRFSDQKSIEIYTKINKQIKK